MPYGPIVDYGHSITHLYNTDQFTPKIHNKYTVCEPSPKILQYYLLPPKKNTNCTEHDMCDLVFVLHFTIPFHKCMTGLTYCPFYSVLANKMVHTICRIRMKPQTKNY